MGSSPEGAKIPQNINCQIKNKSGYASPCLGKLRFKVKLEIDAGSRSLHAEIFVIISKCIFPKCIFCKVYYQKEYFSKVYCESDGDPV